MNASPRTVEMQAERKALNLAAHGAVSAAARALQRKSGCMHRRREEGGIVRGYKFCMWVWMEKARSKAARGEGAGCRAMGTWT